MKLFKLEARQVVPVGVDEAWAFFSDARNLSRITPPSLGFHLLSELPAEMYAGMIIPYRVRPLFGVPIIWITEITHVDKPRLFVDEQRFGPYRFWHHQHHFRKVEGGTEIRDVVHHAPPSPAGRWVERWVVGPRLREIFGYRRRVLEEVFGGSTG